MIRSRTVKQLALRSRKDPTILQVPQGYLDNHHPVHQLVGHQEVRMRNLKSEKQHRSMTLRIQSYDHKLYRNKTLPFQHLNPFISPLMRARKISFCANLQLGLSIGKCIALRFVNSLGHPFQLISHMKTDGWRVTGEEFKIRLTFKNPELHKFITFRAEDLYGKLLLLLDGDRTISVMPRVNCDEYIDVTVTGIPGTRFLLFLQKQAK